MTNMVHTDVTGICVTLDAFAPFLSECLFVPLRSFFPRSVRHCARSSRLQVMRVQYDWEIGRQLETLNSMC